MRRILGTFLLWLMAALPLPAAAQGAPEPAPFKPEELEQLAAPIALYPDALVAQILMAATYPLEVVAAARWVKANPGLKEKALEDALQKLQYDLFYIKNFSLLFDLSILFTTIKTVALRRGT